MRIARPAIPLALAVAALMASAPAAVAQEPTTVGRFAAKDCVEVAAIVSLPPATSQVYLPTGVRPASFYTTALAAFLPLPVVAPVLKAVTLEASLLMGVETCQSGTIGDTVIDRPFAFGERVLGIQPLDGAPGFHFYAVEQVSDNRQLVAMLRDAGFDARYVPGISGRKTLLGGQSRGDGVDIDDTAPVSFPSPLTSVSIWKRLAGGGSSVLRLDVTNASATAGVGAVTVRPGTTIAKLVGATQAVGLGAVNSFDFTGTIQTTR